MSRSIFVALVAAVVGAQRVRVSLDFGWRTVEGVNPGQVCTLVAWGNNSQCMGLSSVPGASDVNACAAAACAASQPIWQFCPSGTCGGGEGGGCWIGQSSDCVSNNGWIGATIAPPSGVPPIALPSFDDSALAVVDLPHDFEITGNYSENANGGEAFLPQNFSFYRKHFALPASWAGTYVELYVEGALSVSTWWLNGVPLVPLHTSGYTSIVVGLSGLTFGGGDNLLVAHVDGTETTGWWYEGSGLVRHVWITSLSSSAHVATHSVFAPATITGAVHTRATTAAGLWSDGAVLSASFEAQSGPSAMAASVATATFSLVDVTGAVVATATVSGVNVPPNGDSVPVSANLTLSNAELWSIPRPYLYTLVTSLTVGGSTVDSTNTSVGIRSLSWDSNSGLSVNTQPVKMRGYCNHESFAGVGAALADRIDLFRVQQVRGVGGNAWRTSHNAPEPILLALTDILGIAIMDENRVFATEQNCPGCSQVPNWPYGGQVQNFRDLIRRDKNHPSVFWWSACNEAGCGNGNGTLATYFRQVVYEEDGSRGFGANMGWLSPITPSPMSAELDIMGFSHASAGSVASYHSAKPNQPLVMSECCSCETQRGEDNDLQPDWPADVYFSNENSGCVRDQTQASNAVAFDSGTFVWTMHDYVGEPGNWPHVSSSFGSYDLAGFPKAPVWWYRSWWLANISTADAGRPPLPNTSTFVHIVESWQPPATGKTARTINVYSNAPSVRLSVNGGEIGTQAMSPYAAATFSNVKYVPGTLVADALDASGTVVLASTQKLSWGAPAALVLTIDTPSLSAGTGSSVYLDGQDVALIRCTVVDSTGATVHSGSINVTFSITDGPGYVWASHNGDPACQEPSHSPTKSTYHGLARAIVRPNVRATGSADDRALEAMLNPEAGKGPDSSTIIQGNPSPASSFTVTVSAVGLPSASVVVPLSVNPADSVLAVAAASVGSAYTGE